MNRRGRLSNEELDALLERGRNVPAVPDVVRGRALARARATVAGGATHAPAPAATGARGRGFRIALAASVAVLVCTAGAVAAFRGGAFDRISPEPASSPHAGTPVRVSRSGPAPAPPVAPQPKPASTSARPMRSLTAHESYAAERGLLQRAQVAYASHDFSAALVLVAEHARRFPNGRLAEEREALRVRSLAGSGRAGEARRAVSAFAARFPRSVLLPRLRESVIADTH
jgi:hypothetical protein